MGFPDQLHSHCKSAGFVFKNGRYYAKSEPTWEKEKRIDKGRKQYAVPASSVEQFYADEKTMVDAWVKRLREKAGVPLEADDDDGAQEEETVPAEKKKKRKATEEEAE